jgi:hypothetical protein
MPRAGRFLEELVYALETMLASTPVEIKSPDFIVGKSTKARREIDVALRSTIGSAAVLIIIECRDRRDVQDLTWIEQLASKREDVGADKAIAVSATGFSQSARNIARYKQIELRSLEELDEDVVFDWLKAKIAEHRTRSIEVTGCQIDLGDEISGITPAEAFTAAEKIRRQGTPYQDDKFLVRKADKTMASIDDVWSTARGLGLLLDDAFPDLPPKEKRRIVLVINFEGPQYCIGVEDGLIDVISIMVEGDFSYAQTLVPIRRYKYVSDSGTITENAEIKIEYEGGRIIMGLHATPDRSKLATTFRSTGTLPTNGSMDVRIDIFEVGDNDDRVVFDIG